MCSYNLPTKESMLRMLDHPFLIIAFGFHRLLLRLKSCLSRYRNKRLLNPYAQCMEYLYHTYIWITFGLPKFLVNIGKYSSDMEPSGENTSN